ncbi:DUF5916 domain-containing protein [Aquimarina rhabdastrellae]
MMKLKSIIVSLFIINIGYIGFSQELIEKKEYQATIIESKEVPIIDGLLDDSFWSKINWEGNFVQREPEENAKPSQNTKFKIGYDNKFLYVAIRCLDTEPDKIVKRMSRRDGFEGDWVEIVIDSYHDLRTAFSFTLSAAGVRGDKAIISNGAEEDISWNPIWYAKSSIDEKGWVAEIKIPFTQLRFGNQSEQTWGLQIVRNFFRNNETSVWQRVPLDAAGWVSEFGKLKGLNNVKSRKPLEIQPYIVGALETFEKDPENPFRDKNITSLEAGLDGKIGVTNDLTLDFTINPDFGQVEADPAAIALDGFQIFFREQRPFFVENKNIFNYQFSLSQAGSTFGDDNLFYSRRIGRAPQGRVNAQSGDFIDAPERTKILGAVKFSGKTKKGLSIGILESVTSRESAEIYNNGNTRKEIIEPLTNSFVARVQQDFNDNNTFIGGILTMTNRKNEENTSFLHKSAITGGVDITHQWKNRAWYASGNLVMSHVKGSKEAILRTQTDITHLFQREDASHVSIDPDRTSLTGTGGNLKFGKLGNGNFNFETGVTWRSPELELNDLGFMKQADDIRNYLWLKYKSIKPFSVFRNASISAKQWLTWDFEGNNNRIEWNLDAEGVFNNNWYTGMGLIYKPRVYSNTILRGGPRFRYLYEVGGWFAVTTDQRKKVYLSADTFYIGGNQKNFDFYDFRIGVTYQPFNQFSISITPGFSKAENFFQYVNQLDYNNSPRYITGVIDQETISMAIRLNYNINTNLSIQYYGEPFVSTGKYSKLNYINDPVASSFDDRFNYYNANQIQFNDATNTYEVDENEDATIDYSFANPDFSFAQFRSNMVLRWEYIPGSELFLVWSQGITDYANPEEQLFDNLKSQLLKKQLDNTFLVKLTYRFLR